MGWFGVRQNAVSGLIFLAVIVPPIAAQGTASREGCPGAAGTSCNAFSTLKIEVTAGECTGQSGANCQALAESKTVIRNALNDWLGGDDRCGMRAREGAATIVAQAVAEVWTSAFSQVRCAGQGFACGWSAANGRAWAEGLSESIAEAAAEAEAGTQFCYADVRALAGVFSESLSQSQAEVCTSNGDAEAFLSLYQKTVETQIAESFAAANAEACASGGASAASQSLCTDGEFELGDICGGIVQNECEGDGKKRCCNPNFKRRVCRCKGRKLWSDCQNTRLEDFRA
ncbi:hypothetical protein BSKO_03220 [Bryopsis sp. KO-2023]|nr:hypothetical protein BSKO_03220 [Bryopsis sp. KO-2023]